MSPTAGARRSGRSVLAPALLVSLSVSVVSMLVFCATAARDVTLGDAPGLVAVARTLGVAPPPGYPLYTLVSALAVRIPAGTPFLRMSLLSALFGAAAAGVLSLLVWEIASTRWSVAGGGFHRAGAPAVLAGSAVAGIAFAMAPAVWSQCTAPSVYPLSSLLVFGALWILVRWRRLSDESALADGPRGERMLWAGGFVLGLSLTHHLTAALAVPSAVVAVSAGHGRHATTRSALRMLLFVAAALSLYYYLPLRASQDPAVLSAGIDSLRGLLEHVVGARQASALVTEPLPGAISKVSSFVRDLPGQLTWPILSLSGIGLAFLWVRSKRLLAVLALELVLVVAHAAGYSVPDVASYFIPVYAVLSVCAGVAVAHLPRLLGTRTVRAGGFVAVMLAVAALASVTVAGLAGLPGRDLSKARGGRLYLERLLEEVPEGGMVLAREQRTVLPLQYAEYVEHLRPDIAVLDVRDRAPHLMKWHPDVSFPSERELVAFTGGDPSVACDPPLLDALPLSRYLPLLVQLNEARRPIVCDIGVGVETFLERSVPTGLLVRVVPASGPTASHRGRRRPPAPALGRLCSGRVISRVDDGTPDACAGALADLGRLLLAEGELDEGVQALEMARDIEPDSPDVRRRLGDAYRKTGRFDDALLELGRAIELAPGRAITYHDLYRLHLAADDDEAAVKALRTATQLDPGNLGYRLELASLYENADEMEMAQSVFEWVEKNAGDDLAARLAYGDFLLRRGRYTEAVAAYRRAHEASPMSAGVFTSLSRCYWEMDEMDAAIAAMRRSVELQPHNPTLKYDLALMLQRSGQTREALECLDDVLRLLPGAWQPVALKASILTGLGMYDEAELLFGRARELGADGDDFSMAWSVLRSARGDTAGAAGILRGDE